MPILNTSESKEKERIVKEIRKMEKEKRLAKRRGGGKQVGTKHTRERVSNL